MNKKEFKKHPYVSPLFEIIEVEKTSIICTSLDASHKETEQEEWENESEDGDWIEF